MSLQVAKAVSTWVKPARAVGLVTPVRIVEVNCADPTFDLMLDISRDTDFPSLGSYQMEKTDGAHLYTYIKIDPYFTWQGIQFVDTRSLLNNNTNQSLVLYLNQFSTTFAYPVARFSAVTNSTYNQAFWSTYRDILHETGHAFGLCDTIPSQILNHCDPNFLTNVYANSVMSDSTFLSLTQDDTDGVVELFRRFD